MSDDIIRAGISKAFRNKDILPGYTTQSAYGNSFIPTSLPLAQLAAHITGGYAWTMGYFDGNARTKETFISSEFIALDLDKNVSVADCQRDINIERCACLIHPSATSGKICESNPNGHKKTRVIFHIETPITDSDRWELAQRAAIYKFAHLSPDPSCKDAARLFYGSNVAGHVINLDAVLLNDTLNRWIAEYEKAQTPLQPINRREIITTPDGATVANGELSPALVADVVSALGMIGAPVKGNGFTIQAIACPVKAHEHDNTSPAFYYHPEKQFGKCFKCGETFNINDLADVLGIDRKSYYKKSRMCNNHPLLEQREKPFGPPESLPELATFKADMCFDYRYITQAELPSGDVVIKSAMNTGKTELLITEIAALEKQLGYAPSVLILTHLQSLADYIAKRLGIENYQYLPDGMVGKAGQIVCSYNSIKKLNPNNKFDFIAIDETTLFIEHGFGETMKMEIAYAYPVLKQLLTNAVRVMFLDAHMTDVMTDWLCGIRPHVTTVKNTYKHTWGALQLYSRNDSIIAQAQAAIEENKGTVVITSNSRELTNKLHKMFTDKYGDVGIVVNGETSKYTNSQRLFTDLDNELPKYRWLLCSPSVSTGVNVTTPVYSVFGIFTHQNTGISVAGMVQMIGRFRNAQHRAVYVQNAVTDNPLPTKWETIYGENIERIIRNADVNNFANTGLNDLKPTNTELLELQAKTQAAQNVASNNQFAAFCSLATNEGYDLQFVDMPGNEQIREQLKAVVELLFNEKRELVVNSNSVDLDTWQKFARSGMMTREINAGHERWKIETCIGQTITNESYDLFHKPQSRKALYRFNTIFETFDVVSKRDREQSKTQVFSLYRRNETIIRQLVITGMKAVFGDDMLKNRDVLTNDEITVRFTDWLANHMTDVKLFVDRRVDLSTKAISILRRLLSKVGMKLEYKRARINGKPQYQYWIDRKHLTTWYQFSVTSRDYAVSGNLYQNAERPIAIRDLVHPAHTTGKTPQPMPVFNIQGGKLMRPPERSAYYAP